MLMGCTSGNRGVRGSHLRLCTLSDSATSTSVPCAHANTSAVADVKNCRQFPIHRQSPIHRQISIPNSSSIPRQTALWRSTLVDENLRIDDKLLNWGFAMN